MLARYYQQITKALPLFLMFVLSFDLPRMEALQKRCSFTEEQACSGKGLGLSRFSQWAAQRDLRC